MSLRQGDAGRAEIRPASAVRDQGNPAQPYAVAHTTIPVYNLYGIPVSTDTINWYWTSIADRANYTLYDAVTGNPIASDVLTNAYVQSGLTQNTKHTVYVQAYDSSGSPIGPVSPSTTTFTLATPPFFPSSFPNLLPDVTTFIVKSYFNTCAPGQNSGAPAGANEDGTISNTTYIIESATGNWNRGSGQWDPGISPTSTEAIVASQNCPSYVVYTYNLNGAVPIYVRAHALNADGQASDWVDLVSSYDATAFTATLAQPPTGLYVIPYNATSAILGWTGGQPDPTLVGSPNSSYQVLQTSCVVNGIPDFAKARGPMCGIVSSGVVSGSTVSLDFANLQYPASSALVTSLNTWATYYFSVNVENPLHWELDTPNIQEITRISAPPTSYYVVVPNVVLTGSLSFEATAGTGGSINGSVGLPTTAQTYHLISLTAPGGAFPSNTSVTISTFSVSSDPRATLCYTGGTLCGGDNHLAFEIKANPPLQPKLPLSFTVDYNSGEPIFPGDATAPDPMHALLLSFDPNTCRCVPETGTPSSRSLTAGIDQLGIFVVGTIQPSGTPGSMRIYPNPYYPARDGWLTIDGGIPPGNAYPVGLPAGSRVRIFTLRGELVLDGNADGHGIFTWQGANRGGRAAASGVYLVVVDANGSKAIQKLALIR